MRGLMLIIGFAVALCSAASWAWTYGQQKDPMGRGGIRWADSASSNTITLATPYGGPQRGTLRLRIHPEYGRDVILSVERGQFLCSIEGCSVLLRVDEGEPVRYKATRPTDGTTTQLFINAYGNLTRQLYDAKALRIEADFYRNGAQMLVFNVSGLKWDDPIARETPEERAARRNAQVERMTSCNNSASSLRGDERKQHMLDCLRKARGETAAASVAVPEQTPAPVPFKSMRVPLPEKPTSDVESEK